MKQAFLLLAALALLALGGCDGAAEGSAPPFPEPSPSQAADSPQPETPPPPSEEPQSSLGPLEELLARQTVDDGHDAFLVSTGGRLGTLLVTAERGGWNTDGTFGWYDATLSVWDPQDMDAPLQTIKTRMQGPFDIMLKMEDVNFDGYMDLEFLCIQYVRSLAFQLWLWDEEAGQFVEEPSFIEILDPWVDPESETVIGGTWETWNVRAQTVHRWEDGKLVFVREVKHIYPDPDVAQDEEEVVVYEYVDGELAEVSRGPG